MANALVSSVDAVGRAVGHAVGPAIGGPICGAIGRFTAGQFATDRARLRNIKTARAQDGERLKAAVGSKEAGMTAYPRHSAMYDG